MLQHSSLITPSSCSPSLFLLILVCLLPQPMLQVPTSFSFFYHSSFCLPLSSSISFLLVLLLKFPMCMYIHHRNKICMFQSNVTFLMTKTWYFKEKHHSGVFCYGRIPFDQVSPSFCDQISPSFHACVVIC